MAKLSIATSPKFKRLVAVASARHGLSRYAVRGLLESLWDTAHAHGPTFRDAADVESACDWDGAAGALAALLVELRWLDESADGLTVHAYWEHAPKWVLDRERKRAWRSRDGDTARKVADIPRHGAESRGHSATNRGERGQTQDSTPRGAPSQAKPSQAKPREAKPSQAKPSQANEPAAECAAAVEPTAPPTTPVGPLLLETPPDDPPPAIVEFPCVGTPNRWELTRSVVDDLEAAFDGVDVVAAARRALAWVQAKPTRRKTAKGMRAFLTSWIQRDVDKGKAPMKAWAQGEGSGEFAAARAQADRVADRLGL